jgi:hypothetical protein
MLLAALREQGINPARLAGRFEPFTAELATPASLSGALLDGPRRPARSRICWA